jgi:hypothetical protein
METNEIHWSLLMDLEKPGEPRLLTSPFCMQEVFDYRLDNRAVNPGKVSNLPLHYIQANAGTYPTNFSMEEGDFIIGAKQSERETDHHLR